MSIAIENALGGKAWLWGAPTYKQARIGFSEMKKAVADSGSEINESRLHIVLPTGGEVMCFGLDKPQNIKGFTADGITIDEIQEVKPSAYHEVLRPMLIDTGGQFWGIGTSNGQDWFWSERQKAMSQDDSMVWHAPTLGVTIENKRLVRHKHKLENPHIKFSEIEQIYKTIPEHVFRREILCDDLAAPGGLVYDVWFDDYDSADVPTGNVTEAAEYIETYGRIYWAVDDGYVGKIESTTMTFTANSHPRVFLLCQYRPNGQLAVFDEDYQIHVQPDEQINEVLEMGYPRSEWASVDKSAAALKGLLSHKYGVYCRNGAPRVKARLDTLRRWIAPDENGFRRVIVHPRCRHLRAEMATYRYKEGTDVPEKCFDHGPDCLGDLVWTMRLM